MPALQIHRISSEQFVRTFSGKHHFYIFTGVLSQKIQGDFRRVWQRFIHKILDFRHGVKEIIGRHFIGNIGNPHYLGKILGIGQFTVLFLFITH